MLTALALMLAHSQDAPFREPLRPQFYFTAPRGWLNDPNGLVHFRGEYHLFFQHNPFGTQWGNMTWGHAVSRDLVHWKPVENALEPDALGTMFSGSAVIQKDKLVLLYTAAGGTNDLSKGKPFTQCLAVSLDGRTFAKFPGNPVLPHLEAENRDPKVIWHAPTRRWVMALYLNESRFALFGSQDLLKWDRLSNVEISGAGECPDLFPLFLDGRRNQERWVFWAGNGRYRVGRFDGTVFTPETDAIPSNFGTTGYAAQTFFNDPKGRRIQIAWLNNSNFPETAWNQQMGFPTELRLVSTANGPRLAFRPAAEIETLREKRVSFQKLEASVPSGLIDAALEFRVPSSGKLTLAINGHELTYDADAQSLSGLGKSARVELVQGLLKLRILADRASLEVFAQDGLVSMPFFVLPKADGFSGIRWSADPGFVLVRSDVWTLKSAWKP